MKTIIILGAGQFGRSIYHLLNHNKLQLLAYGDNNPHMWNTSLHHVLIMSIEDACHLQSDYCYISVSGINRIEALKKQVIESGYHGKIVVLKDIMDAFDIRSATLYHLSQRIKELDIDGDIGELGVYKGDLAWQMNLLLKEKTLYLFDTFEGFDKRDISIESQNNFSKGKIGDFSDTSVEDVLQRCPYPSQVVIKKGYFPQTTVGLENHQWALISLDADLYEPIYEGLKYFYPRLNHGGMILLHDYNNKQFIGAHQAVEDYEKQYGKLLLIPLSDIHGSCVIIKP